MHILLKRNRQLEKDSAGTRKRVFSANHFHYNQIANHINLLTIQPRSTLKELIENRGLDEIDKEQKKYLAVGVECSIVTLFFFYNIDYER